MKPFAALLAFVGLVTAPVLLAQEAPTGSIVELPKFVVTDNRELPPPESWRYAAIPGFEILSNASDKATQRLIRDFEIFRQALGYAWPMPDRISQTTSLIICGKGNRFDAFVPTGRVGPDVALASLFLKEGNKTAIVIDMASTTLNILNVDDSADAATGTDSGLITVEHDKQLYREYVRFLLSRSEPRLPAWLEEGLSQIIMRMRIESFRAIDFAKLEDPNTISALGAMTAAVNALAEEGDMLLAGAPAEDRDFNAALHRKALVKLDQFFAIKHDSPEATAVLGNNRWAKQAYAFVHMCLYGERGKFQKPFTTFLQRIAREPVSEALFKECFGLTYNQMLTQMRGYIDMTVYESKSFRSKKGGPDLIDPPAPLVMRDATQSEVGRIKGEAKVIAGHAAAGRQELIAPYIRGERDPDLLAALGLFEKNAGEDVRARRFLEAASEGKTRRPDALLELARLRYADAIAAPGVANGRFSREQVNGIVQPLLIARKEPPHQHGVYDILADTWMRSFERPTRDEAIPAIEGAILFPTRLKLIYQASMLAAEINDLKSAHALADHGIKWGPDAAVKKRFQDLKQELPPAPAAEPESAPAATPATSAPNAAAPAVRKST
jgi:hypothetical protein